MNIRIFVPAKGTDAAKLRTTPGLAWCYSDGRNTVFKRCVLQVEVLESWLEDGNLMPGSRMVWEDVPIHFEAVESPDGDRP